MPIRQVLCRSLLRRRYISAPPPRLLGQFPIAGGGGSGSGDRPPFGARAISAKRSTRPPRDDEIAKICSEVWYIDSDGVNQGVKPIKELLSSYDRSMYHLLCVNPNVAATEPPTCRLIGKGKLLEQEKMQRQLEKEKRSYRDPLKTSKSLEFTWAISTNDLGHKMKKMKEFLKKGYKVEIVLGARKGMAKLPRAQMEELVGRIREVAREHGKESKPPEGGIGVQYTLFFEGEGPKKAVETGEGTAQKVGVEKTKQPAEEMETVEADVQEVVMEGQTESKEETREAQEVQAGEQVEVEMGVKPRVEAVEKTEGEPVEEGELVEREKPAERGEQEEKAEPEVGKEEQGKKTWLGWLKGIFRW